MLGNWLHVVVAGGGDGGDGANNDDNNDDNNGDTKRVGPTRVVSEPNIPKLSLSFPTHDSLGAAVWAALAPDTHHTALSP